MKIQLKDDEQNKTKKSNEEEISRRKVKQDFHEEMF